MDKVCNEEGIDLMDLFTSFDKDYDFSLDDITILGSVFNLFNI